MNRSIFNDVIGPVMRGPSSSHTAAAVRIGQLARKLLEEEPVHAIFRFDPSGSLVTTYRGQGSAMGLAGGLLGMQITDPDLMLSEKIASLRGLKIEFLVESYNASHPNTYLTEITSKSGKKIVFTAISTGGGIIRLTHLNGEKITDDFDYVNSLMPVKIKRDALLPFKELSGAFRWVMAKGDSKLSEIAKEYETLVGDISATEVDKMAQMISTVLQDAIGNGLSGTVYADQILPQQSHLIGQAALTNKLIPDELLNRIIESVSAIMETKSSMGIIVAAPTAGACGTLGGTIIPVAGTSGKTEKDISDVVLAAAIHY